MTNLQPWISAFRLRTLPLATAAVLMGACLADLHHSMDIAVAWLCWLTAVLLQVLSNLANDYGDFLKGTDNDQRIGNTRALQSGKITAAQMKNAIILFVVICLGTGISLLYKATEGNINYGFIAFLATGIAAIAAAIKYTVGKNAYGYSGLGDIAVFLFFGPVAVGGTFLLSTHFTFSAAADLSMLMPACAMGLLCTAVLNTNNIRDIVNDKASGKNTIVVKLGLEKARVYHVFLIAASLLLLFVYSFGTHYHHVKLLQLVGAFLIVKNAVNVWNTPPSPAFNAYLKGLSLGILFFTIVFAFTNSLAQVWTSVDELIRLTK